MYLEMGCRNNIKSFYEFQNFSTLHSAESRNVPMQTSEWELQTKFSFTTASCEYSQLNIGTPLTMDGIYVSTQVE